MAGWAASLRDSGLLALAVPRVFAGMERGWGEIFAGVRHLAEQELELARRLALHHLQIASIRLLGSPEQQRRLLPASVERRWLWSEAVDLRRAQPEAQEHWRGGFLVGGRGSDCFAVEDVDRLLISAWHAPSRAHLIAVAETGRAGIDISGLADGSGLFLPAGQRLHYQRLRLHPEDILVPPGLPPTPCGQLREGLTRLAQANLDLGQAARVPGDVAGPAPTGPGSPSAGRGPVGTGGMEQGRKGIRVRIRAHKLIPKYYLYRFFYICNLHRTGPPDSLSPPIARPWSVLLRSAAPLPPRFAR
ncbi:hypothetical protein M770_24505 [Pseudomonas aeruginosa VRFPA03]|nr:hypothetical protein M770_24505 [Pseudomonas aeruginosa VRFPA03]